MNCGKPSVCCHHGNPQPSPGQSSGKVQRLCARRLRSTGLWRRDSPRPRETSGFCVTARSEVRVLPREQKDRREIGGLFIFRVALTFMPVRTNVLTDRYAHLPHLRPFIREPSTRSRKGPRPHGTTALSDVSSVSSADSSATPRLADREAAEMRGVWEDLCGEAGDRRSAALALSTALLS